MEFKFTIEDFIDQGRRALVSEQLRATRVTEIANEKLKLWNEIKKEEAMFSFREGQIKALQGIIRRMDGLLGSQAEFLREMIRGDM